MINRRERWTYSTASISAILALLFALPGMTLPARVPVKCVEDIKTRYNSQAIEKAQTYVQEHPGHEDDTEGNLRAAQDTIAAYQNLDKKIEAIYKASNHYDLPPQFLLGVLMIESSLVDDGIDVDGGNYSCGMSQLDLAEWCTWAQTQDERQAGKMGWPLKELKAYQASHHIADLCGDDLLDNAGVASLIEKAHAAHPGLDLHEVNPSEVAQTSFAEFQKAMAIDDPETAQLKYRTAQSFLKTCTDHRRAIPALAFVLRQIFDESVPAELKQSDLLIKHEVPANCERSSKTHFHPVSPSWLLAAAIYNGGTPIVDGITAELKKSSTPGWSQVQPIDLVINVDHVLAGTEYYGKVLYDWQVVRRYIQSVLSFIVPQPADVLPATGTLP